MTKIRQNLPTILALLEGGRQLIKGITDAIVESGGLGFRKRIKQFVEDTNKVISDQSKAITKLGESIEQDALETEKKLETLEKEIDELKNIITNQNGG